MQQLVLAFTRQTSFKADDFIPMGCNADALEALQKLQNEGHGILYVYGAAGVGKSHFLHLAASRLNIPYLTPETLPEDPTTCLKAVVDMVDEADKNAQEKLFHLFNHIQNQHGLLILAGRPAPENLEILPDLSSRLSLVNRVKMHRPEDGQLEMLLVKFAADRQLELEPGVARFLMQRVERSPRALEGMLDLLDEASLAAQKRITIPLVKQVFNI